MGIVNSFGEASLAFSSPTINKTSEAFSVGVGTSTLQEQML